MFIAIDGNSTGRIIEKMILENDLDSLTRFSASVQNTIQSIYEHIVRRSGKIIMAGGDNVLAEMPPSSYFELLRMLERISTPDYSFSISVSASVQGAYFGLKYAKATNMRMVKVDCHDNGAMSFVSISL